MRTAFTFAALGFGLVVALVACDSSDSGPTVDRPQMPTADGGASSSSSSSSSSGSSGSADAGPDSGPNLADDSFFAAGGRHACVLRTGVVSCWGQSLFGQLGGGDTAGKENPTPVDLGAGRTAKAISVGRFHTCAILDTNALKCWGQNTYAQLGLGDTQNRGDDPGEMGDALPAVDLGVGRTVKSVSAGELGTCAVLDDDTLKCWGYGSSGQLGNGATQTIGDDAGEMGAALAPVDLGAGAKVRQVSVGLAHTCALLASGAVKCFGVGGRLGLGDGKGRGAAPGDMGDALPAVDLGAGKVARISAGGSHTCALFDTGSIKCWGVNASGQLGIGSSNPVGAAPGQMGAALATTDVGGPARMLSAGYAHTCALLDGGVVKCWGENQFGELGLGALRDRRGDEPGEMGAALQPAVSKGAVAVSACRDCTCVMMDDNLPRCFGDF